jgi:hypothetical protein
MLRMSRVRAAVLVVVLVVALSAGAGQAVAAGTAHTTTVVERASAGQDRSPAITVLLVGAGAAVGVIVGVIPALAAAMLLGVVPAPRRASRAGGMLVEPPSAYRAAAPEPRAEPQSAALPELVALDPAAAGTAPEPAAARSGQLAVLAHARHQDVYDAAYAEQLERVGALRSAIGGRRGAAPEAPNDSGPGHP